MWVIQHDAHKPAEMMLTEVAPRILEYIYDTATPNDGITAGPGLPGYTYVHLQPDRIATTAGQWNRCSAPSICCPQTRASSRQISWSS